MKAHLRFRLSLVAALACSIVNAEVGAQSQATTKTVVNLSTCRRMPCVVGEMEGHPVKLLLDLSSNRSYLTTKAVKRLGIRTHDLLASSHEYQESSKVQLRLGSRTLPPLSFYVLEPSRQTMAAGVSRDPFLLPEDGAIALDLFSHQTVQLDLPVKRLTISDLNSPAAAQPMHCGQLVQVRSGDFGPNIFLAQRGFQLNGHDFVTRIDSMFEGSPFLAPVQNPERYVTHRQTADAMLSLANGILLQTLGTTQISFGGLLLSNRANIAVATDGLTDRGVYQLVVGLPTIRQATFLFDVTAGKVCALTPQ